MHKVATLKRYGEPIPDILRDTLVVAEDIARAYHTRDIELTHAAWYRLIHAAAPEWIRTVHRGDRDPEMWHRWVDQHPSVTPTRQLCHILQYVHRLPQYDFTSPCFGVIWALGSIVTVDPVTIPHQYHVLWSYLRRLVLTRGPHPTVAWARRSAFIQNAVTEAAQYTHPIAATSIRMIAWDQLLLWIDVLIRLYTPKLIPTTPIAEGTQK